MAAPTPAKRRAALEALCLRLGDRAVAREVLLALDEPAKWIERHDDDDDFDGPFPGLVAEALRRALERRRRCAAMDWRWPFDDTRTKIERLPGFPRRGKLWSFVAEEPVASLQEWLYTDGQLALCAQALEATGMSLLELIRGDADAYAVVLVKSSEADAIIRQFAAAGLKKPLRLGSRADVRAGLAEAEKLRREKEAESAQRRAAWSKRWRYFLRDRELWVVRVDGKDVFSGDGVKGREKPKRKRAANDGAALALAEAAVAAHTADGYREINLRFYDESLKRPYRIFKGANGVTRSLHAYPNGIDIRTESGPSRIFARGRERDRRGAALIEEWRAEGFQEMSHLQYLVDVKAAEHG